MSTYVHSHTLGKLYTPHLDQLFQTVLKTPFVKSKDNDDNGEYLGKVVDRLHRHKVLVNQATSTNVYTSSHNLP